MKQLSKYRNWLTILTLLMLCALCYLPILQNDFTNWDDGTYVIENELVTNYAKHGLKAVFTTPVSLNYHPLTILSLAANHHFSGLEARGYHLTNLTFHLFNIALLFLFIGQLTGGKWMVATLCALWFGIHPMHLESVAWVSARKDVLSVFFALLSLLSYLKYIQVKKALNQSPTNEVVSYGWNGASVKWRLLAGLFFLCSLLCKATMVVLPLLFLLIDYFKNRAWRKWVVLEKMPFFVLSLLFGGVAFYVQSQGAIADFELFPWYQRLMFASYGCLMYVVKLFAPFQLSAFYPYPVLLENGGLPVVFYLAPFVVLGLLGGVFAAFKKGAKWVVFGALFFLINVALVLQLVSVGNAIMADRYTYFAHTGLIFIVGYALHLSFFKKNNLSKKGVRQSVGAKIKKNEEAKGDTILKENSFSEKAENELPANVEEKNTASLFSKTGGIPPPNPLQRGNKDLLLSLEGDRGGKAFGDTLNLLKWAMLGTCIVLSGVFGYMTYERTQVWKNSETLWSNVLKNHPHAAVAYRNRGNFYAQNGQTDLALQDYAVLLQMNKGNDKIYSNLGNIYGMKGEMENALKAYSEALAKNPNSFDAYFNRGTTYGRMNRFEDALADFQKAYELQPNSMRALSNRAFTYSQLGNYEKAIADYDVVIEQQPNVLEHYMQRGVAKMRTEQWEAALQDFDKALQIKSHDPKIYLYKAQVFAETSQYNKANEMVKIVRDMGHNVPDEFIYQLQK